ncbi:MAG: nuclear transport factor 2 family protein [Deltaproteobacteria bacterium]|nr:nuclear transport factor 2 family protein [Deltaproteobacteria bacterium]
MKPIQIPITGKEDRKVISGPLAALSEFYEAFNCADIGKMSKNWMRTDEVAMDNPVGGIKRGWEEIRSVYERIFNGPASVYVEFYDYTIHEGRDLFYAVGRERGEFRLNGVALELAIRTSRIYRLSGGLWRQVHHHGSIDDPELLSRYQNAVRSGR